MVLVLKTGTKSSSNSGLEDSTLQGKKDSIFDELSSPRSEQEISYQGSNVEVTSLDPSTSYS